MRVGAIIGVVAVVGVVGVILLKSMGAMQAATATAPGQALPVHHLFTVAVYDVTTDYLNSQVVDGQDAAITQAQQSWQPGFHVTVTDIVGNVIWDKAA